jgi:3'-5' exoribonuclease
MTMTKQMVAELQPNEPVDSVFLIADVQLRTARNGSNFLNLTFQDRSGQVSGRMWDVTEAFAATISRDDFVHVHGRCETYQNQIQIVVKKVTRADTETLRLGEFLPQSERDPLEMMREMTAILAQIEDKDYKAVVDSFLADKEFCALFRTAPAAMSNHHSYLGGLLEHTLSMMQVGVKICEHYTTLRRDLLLTGVLLHDIGKIEELSFRRSFRYTTPGNLVGHIMLGTLMLEERGRNIPEFPVEKLNMLRHMILSHHGQFEFGSPRLPMFAEAMALHYLDNLDAKLKDISDIIAEDSGADEEWTNYHRRLERKLYKG